MKLNIMFLVVIGCSFMKSTTMVGGDFSDTVQSFFDEVVPVSLYKMALKTCEHICFEYEEYVTQGCPLDEKPFFTDLVIQRLGKLCDAVDQMSLHVHNQSMSEVEHLFSVIHCMHQEFQHNLPIEMVMVDSVLRLVDKVTHNLKTLGSRIHCSTATPKSVPAANMPVTPKCDTQ